MKKILLTISILALCLLCFVGCASFTDLNTPHKVTINVTRLSNVPSELKIDVTTTLGEITSSGDSHVIQAPRLKNFTVTVSAKGYKSRVITITPQELVEEKVIAVEFGATLIDEQNSVRLNSDPARGVILESDGSITMLCEFSRSINIKFQMLKPDNTPFVGEVFYLNDSPLPYANSYYTLTTQYSAEQILVQLRCGSFDLVEYVIISSSDTLTKNIDGSFTYNRPLHLQATQGLILINEKGAATFL